MQDMYEAIPNSPVTTITQDITDTVTTITLADASKLPNAPNIATIGNDEQAETIKYTGKDGNNLTGVTRGFEGTARAWGAGTIISRNMTAYDNNAFKGNIEEVSAGLADIANVIVASGTGTTITLSMPSVTAYTDNMKLTFISSADNSGSATTIDINSLGAKNLYKPNTTTAPNLKSGKPYTVWYNGTHFFLQASAEGDALAEHVLAGKIFSNDDDTGIVGTLIQGRKVATLAFPSSVMSQNSFGGSTNVELRYFNVPITGIGFKPSMAIVRQSNGSVSIAGGVDEGAGIIGLSSAFDPSTSAIGTISYYNNDNTMFNSDGVNASKIWYARNKSYADAGIITLIE
ncbi:hypothetical protein [Vallitalea maricola]|uniref:Uncharacterized protein n=1 Tax=Vallitalea maricola TaxID=3074433 RepID=A0ACB5UF30_9FIRM|nr:hypothetical protein AN2V17_04380 [Vallitalea sp. AN17-2]